MFAADGPRKSSQERRTKREDQTPRGQDDLDPSAQAGIFLLNSEMSVAADRCGDFAEASLPNIGIMVVVRRGQQMITITMLGMLLWPSYVLLDCESPHPEVYL